MRPGAMSGKGSEMLRLLVAYDGGAGGRAAVGEAGRLAREAGAEVTVLRIVDPLVDAASVRAETREAALTVVIQEMQEDLAGALADAGLPAGSGTVERLPHGEDIPGMLARVAAERAADMLVVGSKRASGIRGLVLGSVTQHVLRLGPCPVLVVHPAG